VKTTSPSKTKTKKVPRTRKPDDMTLADWQRALRRQYGRDAQYAFKNLGREPVFSDFEVTNPDSQSTYRVAIRGSQPGDNFCACPDYAINTLGTCKHIEFVVGKLERARGGKAAFHKGYHQSFSEVYLRYGVQRAVAFKAGANCPPTLRTLVTRYFDGQGLLKPEAFRTFPEFVKKAQATSHEVRLYEDALRFVAHVRDKQSLAERIDTLMPQGASSPLFETLVSVPLYSFQREGTLFAAKAGRCLLADDMGLGKTVQALAAAELLARSVGIERVILSRELSLDEVAEIRQECPDIELEVFVHGALCIAYSGRCLLSGYFNHRDPNQGTCTNSCRWDYKTLAAEETPGGVYKPAEENMQALPSVSPVTRSELGNGQRHPLADKLYLLEEKNRPGDYTAITEDEHGTYIMNSKDLRAVEHVGKLIDIGIDCLKIEGRTKSHYYVARATQSYRQAIDAAQRGEKFNPALLGDLENLANRGYTDGFFERHHTHEYQNYIDSHSKSRQQSFVGEVLAYDKATGIADIEVKNKFATGDRLQLISPEGNIDIVIEEMVDQYGKKIDAALGSGYFVKISLPEHTTPQSLLARYLQEIPDQVHSEPVHAS